MISKQEPEKSREDQFLARGESERRSAVDRLQADMQKDRVWRRGRSYESHADNVYHIIKEGAASGRGSGYFSAALRLYPGLEVGGIVGLLVVSVLREFLPSTPFWLVIAFAVLAEVVRRITKRIAVRRRIALPELSLRSFPGALVGSLIGFLLGLLVDSVFMGLVAPIVVGAVIGEATYRLIRYAVPD